MDVDTASRSTERGWQAYSPQPKSGPSKAMSQEWFLRFKGW